MGIIPSLIIAYIAFRKGSLNTSGAVTAVFLGTSIFALGGVIPYILMVVFFISSSIFSKLGKKRKKSLDNIHEKGDKRDYIQVFANGGIALFCLFLFKVTDDSKFFIAAAVSFAASNSDTWASELGVLGKGKTISLIRGKVIERGISGGVSLFGTIAALLGSLLIASIFTITSIYNIGYSGNTMNIFFTIALCGFLGSIIDSIIGDTIQGQYKDNINGIITEKKYSDKGKNELIKGYSIINNDIVNVASNLIATVIALIIL